MIDSHPALKCVSPQAPVSDWFIGDDFHHNGCLFLDDAFGFLQRFEQKLDDPTRENPKPFDYKTADGYEFYLGLGPLANADKKYFKGKIAFWNDIMAHPNYDEWWQARRMPPHLKNVHAAVMTVGGWNDAEDLYGTLKMYRETERLNPGIYNVLVMGPWSHGQWSMPEGDHLGNVAFDAKTAQYYREHFELPFLKHFLKDDDEGAINRSTIQKSRRRMAKMPKQRHSNWPKPTSSKRARTSGGISTPGRRRTRSRSRFICTRRATVVRTAGRRREAAVRRVRERSGQTGSVHRQHRARSDRRIHGGRPTLRRDAAGRARLSDRRADGRRHARRPDLGARLQVSTSGTDSDFVVKLIDVYSGDFPNPDPNPAHVQMGGYQQLVRGEPMRGKFRNSYEQPEPFHARRERRPFDWTMPDVFHTFRRGHRIMIQVQSSWFPLMDRNPQNVLRHQQGHARRLPKGD